MIPFMNPLPDKSKAATDVAAAAIKIRKNEHTKRLIREAVYKLQQIVFLIGVPPVW